MLGHGRPTPGSRLPGARSFLAELWRAAWCCALVALALISPPAAPAAEVPVELRLRIEWGGGVPTAWQGRIALSAGRVVAAVPLGMEADLAGTVWIEGDALAVRQRGPRGYQGVDLTVAAPLDAALRIEYRPSDGSPAAAPIDVRLDGLLDAPVQHSLDGRDNRLTLRRVPGDALRVRIPRDHLVFAPGDLLQAEVTPYLVRLPAGTRTQLSARVVEGRTGRVVWNDTVELTAPAGTSPWATAPLSLAAPSAEGVYDLVVELSRANLPTRLGFKQVDLERRVQFVVVAPAVEPRAVYPAGGPQLDTLTEIDPTSPAWWDRWRQLPLVPTPRRGPLGSEPLQTTSDALGSLALLGAGGREPNVSWQAFPLTVSRPGEVHLLEIEYPTNRPQTLGISIVEPNAAGQYVPVGLDSGLHLGPEAALRAPGRGRHRMLVWPRTAAPILLLANRQEGVPAAFGRIRFLGPTTPTLAALTREALPPARLPRALAPERGPGARLVAAYYDRPLVAENFLGPQGLDTAAGATQRCLDDWHTFHAASTRLVEYLQFVGYNGLVFSAVADGAALYPSQQLESSLKYDDGAFFASGQDPVRKDVVELLARLCDREGLRLVPAVDFSAPLAALEAARRRGGAGTAGLELIGPDGGRWLDRHAPREGLAPYYNPLDPRVQAAMLDVIRELVARYERHPSLAGVAVQLSADGYAQLPGLEWGLDEATLARFEAERKLDLWAEGARTPTDRAALVLSKHRAAWTEWRCQTLATFYRRLAEVVAEGRSDRRLYLTTAHALDRPELQRALRPTLPRGPSPDDVLKTLGLDVGALAAAPGVVLLRGQRVAASDDLAAQAVNLEVNGSLELDQTAAAQPVPGSLFFHEPLLDRVPSFDAKGLFPRSAAYLVTHAPPAGPENRRRFVHALATLDAQVLADGGWMLPLGQEEELRDLVAAYRELPAARFETVAHVRQPVVVRRLDAEGRTYTYVVNDSPWPVAVRAELTGPAAAVELAGVARLPGQIDSAGGKRIWSLNLEPYALAVGVFDAAGVGLSNVEVELPPGAADELNRRLQDLLARAAALQQSQPMLANINAGFEREGRAGSGPDGWQTSSFAGSSAVLDATDPHDGQWSVRLESTGQTSSLVSEPFAVPASRRLSVSVWLRVADAERQPPLRLALEGELDGQAYYRFAAVGQGTNLPRIGSQWSPFVFQLDDLPPEGLRQLRVRFDLMGPGQVWIDDVELRDLEFTETERLELGKTLILAGLKLQRGEWSDGARLMDGYWPRFLRAHVAPSPAARPTPSAVAAPATPAVPSAPTGPVERTGGVMDRLRRMWPVWSR